MMENKFCSASNQKENICIDTYRVLDSCRDKDCFENVRVYLTGFGEEIIDRTSVVRAKSAKIVSSYIDINDVPFNRGFYQVSIKIYVKICFEACISHGNVQEFDGIAIVEKKVILYGSEGNVKVFKSAQGDSGFCKHDPCVDNSSNAPIAVLETVDPIILDVKVVEPRVFPCCCCCCLDDIPEYVYNHINGKLCERDDKALVVSLGFFSVVKIERPTQIIVNATEYNIPDKECITAQENDPCTLFKSMAFPISEFSPQIFNNSACPCSGPMPPRKDKDRGCGCNN